MIDNWLDIVKDAVLILRREEGWRPYIYDDHDGQRIERGQLVRGYPTAMYGMTHFVNDAVPEEIYRLYPKWGDMGLALYVKKIIDYDLQRFKEHILHLNPARLVVLVSMIYQLGTYGVLGFRKMREAILAEDWQWAADEMLYKDGRSKTEWSSWHQQTPKRCEKMAKIMMRGTL